MVFETEKIGGATCSAGKQDKFIFSSVFIMQRGLIVYPPIGWENSLVVRSGGGGGHLINDVHNGLGFSIIL